MNEEKKIALSNDQLLDIRNTIASTSSMADTMAIEVSSIPLSEEEKQVRIKCQKRNICADMLWVLSESLQSLNVKLTQLMKDAGGDY